MKTINKRVATLESQLKPAAYQAPMIAYEAGLPGDEERAIAEGEALAAERGYNPQGRTVKYILVELNREAAPEE